MNSKYLVNRPVNYIKDPLHKNALFLIATNATAAIFGFFFWTIAARLFPVNDVGHATALISAVSLLTSFSGLGLGIGLIRFLPDEKDKPGMLNTAVTVVSIFSLILALVFWWGIEIWTPPLAFLKQNALLSVIFILFVAVNSVLVLQGSIFIAFRRAQYSFFQSLIAGLRMVILPLLAAFGVSGIFSSYALGFVVAFIGSIVFVFILCSQYRPLTVIKGNILKKLIRFSLGNYIGDCFRMLPGVVMPLIIINILSADMNAYFYIAWMIASFFFIVSYATSSSLLAESSHNVQDLRKQVIKAVKFIFIILIPAIIVVYFIGEYLLHLFGEKYSVESIDLLRILVISSIPVAINEIYISIYRIKKKIVPVIAIYGWVALFTIICSYFLIDIVGIMGVGIAYLIGNSLASVFIILMATIPPLRV